MQPSLYGNIYIDYKDDGQIPMMEHQQINLEFLKLMSALKFLDNRYNNPTISDGWVVIL
jgi:hypothetical protein